MSEALPHERMVPRASVVIPAHDEATVIDRCLSTLASAARRGELEVVVVSNGSTDATVEVATESLAAAPWSRVDAIDVPSKTAAIRRGDEIATAYPRVYLDADIRVDESVVLDLVATLAAMSGPAVGAPALRVDTAGSPWPVRAYHRVWRELPYCRSGVIGTGIYAVNEAGGRRLGAFPDVLNDDEWVRRQFDTTEQITTAGEFVALAPRTVRALVLQRARVEVGNREIDGHQASTSDATGTSASDLVAAARAADVSWPDVASYAGVVVAARLVSRWRRWRGRSDQWSTDTTTRTAAEPAPAQGWAEAS